MSKEALSVEDTLKLALEALEKIRDADTAGATPKQITEARKLYEPTIAVIEEALAQAKHNPVGFYDAENKDLRREIPMGEDGDWWQPVYTTLPQRKPLTEWQPIDTAPKGKLGYSWMLLAWGPEEDKNVCYGMRHEDKFYAAPSFYCLNQERKYQQREIEINPTHWMPVPNAPIEAANGIKE